jgi:hypothetical protein
MISKEEAVILAVKAAGYSEVEVMDVFKDPRDYWCQEGDSDWRPSHWCPYNEKMPDKYYSACWIINISFESRLRGERPFMLDGSSKWYWVDQRTGKIVHEGSCGGG